MMQVPPTNYSDLPSTLSHPSPPTALHLLAQSTEELALQYSSQLSPATLPLLSLSASRLSTAQSASTSILHSLAKLSTGNSAASTQMRQLESQRLRLEREAAEVELALRLRALCEQGALALRAQRYADVARAVQEAQMVLHQMGDMARRLAGEAALEGHGQTRTVVRQALEERFREAVHKGDVQGLSEYTPLLGMVGLDQWGVALYLEYSASTLQTNMDKALGNNLSDDHMVESLVDREEGMSRAAMRRRAEEEKKQIRNMTLPQKLASIYNVAVTHLRHHLPMVAFALGDVEGDKALVQLVYQEAEKRAVELLKMQMHAKDLALAVRRAERVAAKIEEKYTGAGGGSVEEGNIAFSNVFMNLGVAAVGESAMGPGYDATSIRAKRTAALRQDCGFTVEVGKIADVDAQLEEWALILQHTESYERFLNHAVDEVKKARKIRNDQKREEKKRFREIQEIKASQGMATIQSADSPQKSKKRNDCDTLSSNNDDDDEEEKNDDCQILPPHTQLNEVAAEIGGNYSSLERCLLLAGMQRAFIHAAFPEDTNFSPVTINRSDGGAHNQYSDNGTGAKALQTTLVEECLYVVRRSTLRAFATGHTGTASAAANVCVDVLGRVLLEVLTKRAELGASLLKPGEGLLDGQSGLGQVALSFAKSTAGKGLRGVQGAAARAGASKDIVGDMSEETASSLRIRTMLGVARATANFNDLEVVVDYTKKLEIQYLKEIDEGYPQGHDTEQLRMCVKGLGGVVESFSVALDRSIERLLTTIMPRVRQIVNDAVGQEGGSTTAATASNFLGSPVLTGGTSATISTRLEYNLDEEAFELAQISEGYIVRMCSNLDELMEPLRLHLLPKIFDEFLIGVLGGVAKRLEAAIRKSKFTPVGAISLDSDIRYLMSFAKDRIDSTKLKSNVSLCKACPPLARLNQISLLLNVDDLEDVLDLISVSKRKGNWDLNLDDAKTLLSMRVDFEGSKVNDLLQLEDGH